MAKSNNLLEMLLNVFGKQKNTPAERRKLKKNFNESFNEAFKKYDNLSDKEKNIIRIELAQDMGCESDDLATCSKYIYEATYGSAPPKVH